MEGKQTLIQQFFASPSSPSSPSPSSAQDEYTPVPITPLRMEAAEATTLVVGDTEEETVLLTLTSSDNSEQGDMAVYEAGDSSLPINTPKVQTEERRKVSGGKKVTFPTHLKGGVARDFLVPFFFINQ